MKMQQRFSIQWQASPLIPRPASLLKTLQLLLFLLPTLGLRATTYYVSPSGSDSNPGTLAQPWRTWQKGFNTAVAGDTVNLLAGNYSDGDVNSVRDGADGNFITFIGESGTRLTGGKLYLRHAYLDVRGVEFRRQVVLYGNGAHHAMVRSNVFTANTSIAMYCDNLDLPQPDGPHDNLIAWNTFTNAQNHFVNLNGYNNRLASNLFTINNGWDNVRCSGSNQVIVANLFTNILNDPNNSNHADIIQTFENSAGNRISRDILFERNVIVNSEAQWMNLTGSANSYDRIKDWTFRNNLLINARGQANIYIPGVKFYNNTVWRSLYPNLVRFTGSADRGYAHNGVVLNNLFIESGTSSGNGFYSLGSGSGLTNMTADFNFIADFGGAPKNVSPPEVHGINGGEVKFVDAAGGDFRLQSDSPAIGRGLLIPDLTEDIGLRDRTRKLTFDMGAFMFLTGTPPERPTGLQVAGR
jgi:hypothetical protein